MFVALLSRLWDICCYNLVFPPKLSLRKSKFFWFRNKMCFFFKNSFIKEILFKTFNLQFIFDVSPHSADLFWRCLCWFWIYLTHINIRITPKFTLPLPPLPLPYPLPSTFSLSPSPLSRRSWLLDEAVNI